MNKFVFAAFLILIINSCHRKNSPDGDPVFFTDIDQLAWWSENPTIIHFKGHSGNYVCRLDTVHMYSLPFKKKMGEITNKPILRAEVSAWVYVNQIAAKGNIVCALDSAPGKGYVYFAEPFEEKLNREKKWTRISSVFYFPKTYHPEFIFSAYFWNTGKEELFVDDIQVKITAY